MGKGGVLGQLRKLEDFLHPREAGQTSECCTPPHDRDYVPFLEAEADQLCLAWAKHSLSIAA